MEVQSLAVEQDFPCDLKARDAIGGGFAGSNGRREKAAAPDADLSVARAEDVMPVLRKMLSNVNKRSAQGVSQLLDFGELDEFSMAVCQDVSGTENLPAKLQRLQQQLVAGLHQHFRRRWPVCKPDWSPEERARGLDRPSANRTFEGHHLDLSAVGVPYMNAALVRGLAPGAPDYVVTQHPLRSTVSDFWLMALAVQPAAIVMLNGAPEPEDIDLPPYWLPAALPNGSGGLPGPVLEQEETPARPAPLAEPDTADVTVRWFRCRWRDLEWRGPHVTVAWWRDQSAPPMDKFLALERMLERVLAGPPAAEAAGSGGSRPLIVHCAGGIGRAGVFVAADLGARAVASGADPAGCSPDALIEYLRARRMNMVQTAEQYEFLHSALPLLTARFRTTAAPGTREPAPHPGRSAPE